MFTHMIVVSCSVILQPSYRLHYASCPSVCLCIRRGKMKISIDVPALGTSHALGNVYADFV